MSKNAIALLELSEHAISSRSGLTRGKMAFSVSWHCNGLVLAAKDVCTKEINIGTGPA